MNVAVSFSINQRRNPFQKGTDSEKFGTPIKKVLDYRMKI